MISYLELEFLENPFFGGAQHMLHLHGFKDENRLVCLDFGAWRDEKCGNAAGHGRGEPPRRFGSPRRFGKGAGL